MFRTIILLTILQFFTVALFGQQSAAKLDLKNEQKIMVRVEVVNNKMQTAGAQVINFKLTGTALHQYTISKVSPDLYDLDHDLKEIQFEFDGMGQKKKFDSNNAEDMKGPFGPYIQYEISAINLMGIDSAGTTKRAITGAPGYNAPAPGPDEKLATIIEMLIPLIKINQNDKLGPDLFNVFKTIPNHDSSWFEGTSTDNEKYEYSLKLNAITDSTIIVDLKIQGSCNSSAEMMGRLTKTNENIEGNGKLIYDRKTGLIKEKKVAITSNGTTEAMGGKVPLSGRLTIAYYITVE